MIVSYQKQQEIKPASENNQKKMEQIIQETESLEADNLLGSALYQDVDGNSDDYTDLLEGSEFVDCRGNTIKHKGLYYVLAYLNYAAYIPESYIQDTFTGLVGKARPDSQNLSQGAINNLIKQNRKIGFNAWKLVEEYLNANSDTITLWCRTNSKKVKKFNFKPIRKQGS